MNSNPLVVDDHNSDYSTHALLLLRTVSNLLTNHAQLHDNIVASRLVRSVMPLLAVMLSRRSTSAGDDEQGAGQGRSKRGKKRGRGYEGDEVFKVGGDIVCVTAAEGDVLLASVDGEFIPGMPILTLTAPCLTA